MLIRIQGLCKMSHFLQRSQSVRPPVQEKILIQEMRNEVITLLSFQLQKYVDDLKILS